MVGVYVSASRPEPAEPHPKPLELARPRKTQQDDGYGQRQCSGPVDPLFALHVPDIARIHAEDAGHGAEREEDDGDGGKGVDGGLVLVLVRVDLLDVLYLPVSAISSTKEFGREPAQVSRWEAQSFISVKSRIRFMTNAEFSWNRRSGIGTESSEGCSKASAVGHSYPPVGNLYPLVGQSYPPVAMADLCLALEVRRVLGLVE